MAKSQTRTRGRAPSQTSRNRRLQLGLASAHAVGGPATVAGVDFEIDCALLDAFKLVELFLTDPVTNGVLRPQPRAGPTSALTAWDYGVDDRTMVEAKGHARPDDVYEWLARARIACDADPRVRCHLVYGAATGKAMDGVDRLVRLAREAGSTERLKELATHDRIPGADELFAAMPIDAHSFLVRIDVEHREPSTLVGTLATRSRALFEGSPEAHLALARDLVHEKARGRVPVHASAIVARL
jgi:hypothetical protein